MQHSLTKQNSRVWLPYVLVEATTNYFAKSSLDRLEIISLWRMKSRMEILNQKSNQRHTASNSKCYLFFSLWCFASGTACNEAHVAVTKICG